MRVQLSSAAERCGRLCCLGNGLLVERKHGSAGVAVQQPGNLVHAPLCKGMSLLGISCARAVCSSVRLCGRLCCSGIGLPVVKHWSAGVSAQLLGNAARAATCMLGITKRQFCFQIRRTCAVVVRRG